MQQQLSQNPTHFAVALKYNPGEIGAPTIIAMGQGAIARQNNGASK